MIDGKAQVSCTYSVAKAEGRDITTLEGVSEEERNTYSSAFAACGGLQCGFCIPGIVIRAKSQVDKKGADLKREDMARHLGAHLCRCTGYVKVLDAIETVAQGTPVEVSLPGGVGSRGVKYEAADLALGDRGYVDDIRIPGMLHGALHLTQHVRADILAIDTSAAESAPGVEAVFTAADIPGVHKVGIIYKDWPVMIGVGERTSYAGDVLAIVVARTRREARAAAELIQVNYARWQFQTLPTAHCTCIRAARVCGTTAIKFAQFSMCPQTKSLLNSFRMVAPLVAKKTCQTRVKLRLRHGYFKSL